MCTQVANSNLGGFRGADNAGGFKAAEAPDDSCRHGLWFCSRPLSHIRFKGRLSVAPVHFC